MELGLKLESAFADYIAGLAFPDYFIAADQVRKGETDSDISEQYIRCMAEPQAESEYPLDTGNVWWQCTLELRTPARDQTSDEAASSDSEESTTQLAKHRAVAAVLEAAILIDDLADQITDAADDLGIGYEMTVMAVQDRRPSHSQDDNVYSSAWMLHVYCAPTILG